MTLSEWEYVRASAAERERLEALSKEQQERERALERRSNQRLRIIVGVLVVASIIGISLTAAVLNQNRVARANETLANQNAATAAAESLARGTQQALAEIERERAEDQADARATQQALAESEQERANQQAQLAFSRELAAAAINAQEDDQELAVLLAMHAWEQAETQEAQAALHQTIGNYRLVGTLDSPGRSAFIALSPNGSRLVSSDEDGANVWDVRTGELLYTRGEGIFISQAAFSPDGKYLVTPNEIPGDPEVAGTLSIWDVATGEELISFFAHEIAAQYVSFNSDGTLFVSVGFDSRIRIWDLLSTLETGVAQQKLEIIDEEDEHWWAKFSPDGGRLVTSGETGVAKIWDTTSGQEVSSLSATGGVSYSVYSLDGDYIVSGGQSGALNVWDVETGGIVSRVAAHADNVQDLVFSPDGARLASTGNDSQVKIWSFSSGLLQPFMTLTGHKHLVISLAFSPDGERLYSGSMDGTVKMWDISPGGSVEPVIYPHSDRVNGVVLNPQGDRLATASFDGTAKIWDTSSGELIHTLSGHTGWVVCLAFSPDGTTLATGGDDATVKLWDVATGKEISTFRGHLRGDGFFKGVMGVAFSPDGERLATAGVDGAARVWDVAKLREADLSIGDELLTLTGHTPDEWITEIAYSPDGSLLSTSSHDNTVVVRQAMDGKVLWTLTDEPARRYWGVTFSPDGQRLAAGDGRGMATVWELPHGSNGTPQQSLQIQIGADWVARLRFSPDGNQIALPTTDGLSIWDAQTGERLDEFPISTSSISVSFSPDNEYLVTAWADGLARLYYRDIDELLERVRPRLTRSLTTEECQEYLHLDKCPADP